MRIARTTILAGGAALLLAGTAAYAAEKIHTMNVSLPEGSIAQIEYTGDVAPKVAVVTVDDARVAYVDRFAELDRMAAAMEAQHQAMMQRFSAMQQAAAQAGAGSPGAVTVVSDLPAGAQYSSLSSTTDEHGCTQTVEYSSDGSGGQPQVTRTSAGSCDKATSDAPVPASAPQQREPEGPGTKV